MRKYFLGILILLALIIPLKVFCQTSYIVKDGRYISGPRLIYGSTIENSQFIGVNENNGIKKYGPKQVSEYGYEDGKTFESFEIIRFGYPSTYFFERLYSGKIKLYYLAKNNTTGRFYFLINGDSLLQVIPEEKEEFFRFLSEKLSDCHGFDQNIKFARFNKSSLTRLFKDYERCSQGYTPRQVFGIIGGPIFTQLNSDNPGILRKPEYKFRIGYLVGIHIDFPYGSSNMTLNAQLSLSTFSGNEGFNYKGADYDLTISSSKFNIPITLRYNFFNMQKCTFLEAGVQYSRLFNEQGVLYEIYYETSQRTFLNEYDVSLFHSNHYGLILGFGFYNNYQSDHLISFNFRAINMNSMVVDDKSKTGHTLTINELLFTISLVF